MLFLLLWKNTLENKEQFDRIVDNSLVLGAFLAAVVSVTDVKIDAPFRELCTITFAVTVDFSS